LKTKTWGGGGPVFPGGFWDGDTTTNRSGKKENKRGGGGGAGWVAGPNGTISTRQSGGAPLNLPRGDLLGPFLGRASRRALFVEWALTGLITPPTGSKPETQEKPCFPPKGFFTRGGAPGPFFPLGGEKTLGGPWGDPPGEGFFFFRPPFHPGRLFFFEGCLRAGGFCLTGPNLLGTPKTRPLRC